MLSDPLEAYRREAGVRFQRVPQEGRALLRDSTISQIRKSQDRSAEVSAFRPGFFVHFYAFRTSFLRAQAKSYYPLYDRRLKALEIGRWIGPKCVGRWADLRLSVGMLN